LLSISSITCIASIFLSVSELLQVLAINHSSLWIPKVDIFFVVFLSFLLVCSDKLSEVTYESVELF